MDRKKNTTSPDPAELRTRAVEMVVDHLRAIAHPDVEADEFLLALGRGPENDQHARGLRLHPGLQIHAVRPDVDVAPGREVAALPAVVLLLPLAGQPRDDVRRQSLPRPRAGGRRLRDEQRGKSLLEVPGGDAALVEHGQQRIAALRPAV